ncbi:MAG: DUF6783 domain-containing protein [Ruminococcus sp.]
MNRVKYPQKWSVQLTEMIFKHAPTRTTAIDEP